MSTSQPNKTLDQALAAKEAITQTIRNQTIAASSEISSWVNANAGSGKTRVLTNRVARLLLRGYEPSHILCLTFTKAAAVEMAHRLFDMLGDWALLNDAELSTILAELKTGDKNAQTDHDLSRARRLFARALETPGGLKIQTIHAFCTSILQRFPLEAGVPPAFKAIEEAEISNLITLALTNTVHDAQHNNDLNDSLTHLAKNFGASGLEGLLKNLIGKRQDFLACTKNYKTADHYCNEIRTAFCLPENATQQSLLGNFFSLCSDRFLKETVSSLSNGGANAKKSRVYLTDASHADDLLTKFDHLKLFFMIGANTPRKKLTDAAVNKTDPTLGTTLLALQEDYIKTQTNLNSLAIIEDSAHLYVLFFHLLEHYEKLKWSQSALDFDDLITHTSALFNKDVSATQWVLYKLDNALQHILVDEAQDTSPWQWGVIEPPMEEFFAGENAHQTQRTFFAVGDQKQSIYSFQGADASVFKAKSISIGERIAAAATFKNIPLTLSFRSTSPVLNFVDAMFSGAKTMEGIDDREQLNHGVARHQDAGIVELWPLVPPAENPKSNPWDAPIDTIAIDNPTRILCNHIAHTIQDWLENKEILESQNRPIKPGDIILLVQSRGPLFKQISKSLSRLNIPVAGVDRLNLLDDIAIQDLLSYGRCLLLPEDDLSLAETLKSPLFGFDDDMLFELAYDRGGKSLWSNLYARRAEKEIWNESVIRLIDTRKIARTKGAYEFYSHIIDGENPSGRHRFFARLGHACADPIDAFIQQTLEYENSNPRNLQGFISWFEKNAGTLKRELDQDIEAVRIMTVHGAKGLEGNIVFLLDAHKKPTTNKAGPIYYCDKASNKRAPNKSQSKYPTLVRNSQTHNAQTLSAKDAITRLAYEEYRRLLYVASTRAKDRLYICGTGKTPKPKAEEDYSTQTWHQIATDGFARLIEGDAQSKAGEITPVRGLPWISEDTNEGSGLRLQTKQEKLNENVSPEHTAHTQAQPNTIKNNLDQQEAIDPSWLYQPCPPEKPISISSPSLLAEYHETSDDQQDNLEGKPTHGYSPFIGEDRFLRGRTVHRLLEILPNHPYEDHKKIADKLLHMLVPDHPENIRAQWRDEVLKVLQDKDFSAVFAPNSKAEVSISGTPKGVSSQTVITGQIDRLAVHEDYVFVVDYKTNQPPPLAENLVADAYLAQMAAYRALIKEIYPGKKVKCALLWTYDTRLMVLSDAILDHAFSRFVAKT